MPDLPWTSRSPMEPGPEYLVMASHLPLRRISSTVRFFRRVSAVRKQLAHADGLVGYTLRAKPLARDYWTLSVWRDQAALREFMRTPPHLEIMTSLKSRMEPTKFVYWSITAADGGRTSPTPWSAWPPPRPRRPLITPAGRIPERGQARLPPGIEPRGHAILSNESAHAALIPGHSAPGSGADGAAQDRT
jgi:quinol monooxygenase YgiN